jgi:hypothetical protein
MLPSTVAPPAYDPQVFRSLRIRHAAFLDQSSRLLNSRVNFRFFMTHLLLTNGTGVQLRVGPTSVYLSVKNVSKTLPFSPIRQRKVRRVSCLPFSR